MAAANKVTLGLEAEAAEAEVGMEMLFTASLVEANGRERLLRADGRTIMECRVLGVRKMDLGYNRLLPLMKILVGLEMLDTKMGMEMLDTKVGLVGMEMLGIKVGIERLDTMVVVGLARLDTT